MTAASPTACQEMILLTQAELDGELTAAEAAAAAAHRATCAECQAAHRIIRATKAAMRDPAINRAMPAAFQRELLSKLRQADSPPALPPLDDRAAPSRLPWWRAGMIFAAGVAMTSVVILLNVSRQRDTGEAIVDAHVRALQPGHLLDLPSADQHNVMPWYAGKIDFAPPVKNLAEQGFPLQGSRLDYVSGHPAAALVYYSKQHPIDLFIWRSPDSADAKPIGEARNGYNILYWTQGQMAFWAISDVSPSQLQAFVAQWRSQP
jgi:anti-sigma factor RsiW